MLLLTTLLLTVPGPAGFRVESPLQALVDAQDEGHLALPAGVIAGPLVVTRDLRLTGAGRGETIIDALFRGSALTVMPGVTLVVEDLTIRDGYGSLELMPWQSGTKPSWARADVGGGLRVLQGARVEARRVELVGCGAHMSGAAIYLGARTVGTFEDVGIHGAGRAPGTMASGISVIAVERAEHLILRRVRIDGEPRPTDDLMVSVTQGAIIDGLALGPRPDGPCAPRIWLGGDDGAPVPFHLRAWSVPSGSCPAVYVRKDVAATYADMTWPDAVVPPQVRRVPDRFDDATKGRDPHRGVEPERGGGRGGRGPP